MELKTDGQADISVPWVETAWDGVVSGWMRLVAALQAMPDSSSTKVMKNNLDIGLENFAENPFDSTFPFYNLA